MSRGGMEREIEGSAGRDGLSRADRLVRGGLAFFFGAYVLSLFVSMAAMEIASWTSVALGLAGMALSWAAERSGRHGLGWKPFRIGVDWLLLGIVASTLIGWALNLGRGADLVFIAGGVRWVATLYASAWIMRWFGTTPWMIAAYVASLTIAGVYGVATFAFKWEFIRGRATQVIAEGGWGRAESFLGFSMTWGHTAAMAFCFGVGVLARRPFDLRARRDRWALAAVALATALAGVNVGLTFTRGAWIAAAGGALACAATLGRGALWKGAAALAVVVGVVFATSSDVRRRAFTIFQTTEISSNVQRIQLWEANWLMFEENPLFGVGLNENERHAGEYHRKLGHAGAFEGHAHNNYLQWLASAGAVGFAFFVATFAVFLSWAWRLTRLIPQDAKWERGLALGSFGAQTALHLGGLTECTFKAMTVNHHFVFQLALTAALWARYGKGARVSVESSKRASARTADGAASGARLDAPSGSRSRVDSGSRAAARSASAGERRTPALEESAP